METLLSEGPIALFLDFDGTLVELAEGPDAIILRPRLADALLALAQRVEGRLALVSGRSIENLQTFLGALPITTAGSHGAAIKRSDGTTLGKAPQGIEQAAQDELRTFARELGLDLEEKTHGSALHFRSAPDLEPQAHTFADQIAAKYGLDAKRGKCVVELVERGADKGCAVHQIMSEAPFAGSTPWFIGDDVTDEDGFVACKSMRGGAILVGERANSQASHALRDVAAVHKWLEF